MVAWRAAHRRHSDVQKEVLCAFVELRKQHPHRKKFGAILVQREIAKKFSLKRVQRAITALGDAEGRRFKMDPVVREMMASLSQED